jgi:phosphoglucomutase
MIRFGTSGWRGVVGHAFTFRNVRLVLEATVAVLRRRGSVGEILVSYDTRLLSEKFAREAVDLLTHHGVRTTLSERDLPAPCLAHAVRARGASLGVLFTGSHNSPEYNGLKLYTRDATLAPRDLTDAIEQETERLADTVDDYYVPQRALASAEALTEGYVGSLERDIDWDAVKASGIVVVVDPLYGTAREFLDRILLQHGITTHVLHTTKDPYFGGYAPECSPVNLGALRERVRATGADIGLATDGDADRFGVVDRQCRVVPANLAIALIVEHLLNHRGIRGGVGRTIGTTRLVDRVARAARCEVVETPVGFHHFGPFLLSGRVAIATEESAGLGVAAHLPERDGIFAALLMAELVAVSRMSVRESIRQFYQRHGMLVSRRVQLPWRERSRDAMERILRRNYTEFGGLAVLREDRRDGLLLELERDSWVLIRPAGTEPKIRVYAESTSAAQLRSLVRGARRLVQAAEEGETYV